MFALFCGCDKILIPSFPDKKMCCHRTPFHSFGGSTIFYRDYLQVVNDESSKNYPLGLCGRIGIWWVWCRQAGPSTSSIPSILEPKKWMKPTNQLPIKKPKSKNSLYIYSSLYIRIKWKGLKSARATSPVKTPSDLAKLFKNTCTIVYGIWNFRKLIRKCSRLISKSHLDFT